MAVVDASIVVDWVMPGAPPDGPAFRLLDRFLADDEALFAPHLLQLEVANVLLTGIRRNRWSSADADASVKELFRLPIAPLAPSSLAQPAWELARRFDEHPIYDLVYLAGARSIGDQLFTADATFYRRIGEPDDVTLIG